MLPVRYPADAPRRGRKPGHLRRSNLHFYRSAQPGHRRLPTCARSWYAGIVLYVMLTAVVHNVLTALSISSAVDATDATQPSSGTERLYSTTLASIGESPTAISYNRSGPLPAVAAAREPEPRAPVAAAPSAPALPATLPGKAVVKTVPPSRAEREAQYFRRQTTKVNPYRHSVRLAPSGVCRNETRTVIVVHSHPSYADRREAIRQTWGHAAKTGRWPIDAGGSSMCCGGMELIFSVGLDANQSVNAQVELEYLVHRDVMQGDFVDDYRNMTLKSLLDLKFVAERCSRVQYLLKSDDDMIINLPYLVDVIRSKEPMGWSILGPFNGGSKVYRRGVWALTLDEYPFERFPPYESGSAYVIAGDLVPRLFEAAEYVPSIFIDDVYITGILGRILGVKHVQQTGFAYWGNKLPTVCDIALRKIITGTKMTPQRLLELWEQLRSETKC